MTRLRALSPLLACLLLATLLAGCSWFKRRAYEGFGGRDGWQQPEEVIRVLDIAPGAHVADLGAGGGYFTFRLADAVGPAGRVYAVDVDPDMIEYLTGRIEEEGADNVEVVLAEFDDPKLPESGVDLLFTVNTYHHIEDRPAYFARTRTGLRPGGRVAIIDLLPKGLFQRIFPHSTRRDDIEQEMQEAGYRLAESHDFLERQSFLVFEPSPEATR